MNAAAGEDAGDGGIGVSAPFPWDLVMHVGFSLLRLSSEDFWALTPVEFFLMTGGARPRAVATGRGELEELMRAFPDR
ncbi:phage tail assembly chaperone [Rhizobium wenxiniae]|uniref:rcc01693 family protein n=1 Tax=Rhizobium wenxiniae TaxID=1737357 RepID=UPI001C6E1C4E|nr:rcc01693 family protein [Rhizobium wenxiniae]MBW9090641.1 phage tail assembly chaperone [Rhizobium wenxiniae]